MQLSKLESEIDTIALDDPTAPLPRNAHPPRPPRRRRRVQGKAARGGSGDNSPRDDSVSNAASGAAAGDAAAGDAAGLWGASSQGSWARAMGSHRFHAATYAYPAAATLPFLAERAAGLQAALARNASGAWADIFRTLESDGGIMAGKLGLEVASGGSLPRSASGWKGTKRHSRIVTAQLRKLCCLCLLALPAAAMSLGSIGQFSEAPRSPYITRVVAALTAALDLLVFADGRPDWLAPANSAWARLLWQADAPVLSRVLPSQWPTHPWQPPAQAGASSTGGASSTTPHAPLLRALLSDGFVQLHDLGLNMSALRAQAAAALASDGKRFAGGAVLTTRKWLPALAPLLANKTLAAAIRGVHASHLPHLPSYILLMSLLPPRPHATWQATSAAPAGSTATRSSR